MSTGLEGNRPTEFIRRHWFALCLTVFIIGFFWAPTTKLLNNIYYVFVLLPLVTLFVINDGRLAKLQCFIRSYSCFCVFVLLLLLSSLLSGIELGALGKQLTRVVYIIGFLLAIKMAVQNSRSLGHRLLPVIMAAVSLASCYIIYLDKSIGLDLRLKGQGISENSVRLGAIYGFAVVAALVAFLKGQSRASYFYLIPAGLAFAVIILSQSRGPLLAATVASVVAILFIRGKRSGVVVLLVATTAMSLLTADALNSRFFNLDSLRVEIWTIVLDKVQLAPWFGYGFHAAEAVDVGVHRFEHPHGVYITTLFFGGIFSLAAFLIMIALLTCKDLKSADLLPWRILLCFGLVYMLFDGSRLFYHPREVWLVFWLPIGVLLAITTPKFSP